MRLLALELKRVLKTRLTAILLMIALLLTFITAYMPVTFSHVAYTDATGTLVELNGSDALEYIQEAQASIAGDVTTEKMHNALVQYQAVLTNYGVKDSYELPIGVYDTEILPYSPLLHGIKEIFANPTTGVAPSLMDIDPQRLDDYYGACKARIQSLMYLEQKDHPAAQQAAIAMYSNVTAPYQYFPAYNTDAMDYQVLLAFLLLCICAIITAPIFTSDYQTGADDILRCTKYGRIKFAATKIMSAFLICGLLTAVCSSLYIFVSNSLFGWESTKTSIQMLFSTVNLPAMTIYQTQWFTAISCVLSILATVSFILFLSSRCKNMVASLSTSLLLCMLPFVVYMALPVGICEWIYSILPSSGAGIQTNVLYAAIDFIFLNIGDIAIWLPHAMLAAYIIEIPLFAALTIYTYANRNA